MPLAGISKESRHAGRTIGAIAFCSLALGACESRAPQAIAAQAGAAAPGKTRTYHVAADDVAWDYAPSGRNRMTGGAFEGDAALVATPTPVGLGRIYKKTVFREYTDATFQTLEARAPEWEHLGILGPLIRAEVGDTIEVVFRNNAGHPHSLHPHGVFYDKASEGADMQPDNPGTWLFHCHTGPHLRAGMATRTVLDASPTTAP